MTGAMEQVRGERPSVWRPSPGLRVDRHRATMAHLASVYPFHVDDSIGEAGPYIGVNVTGGMGGFYFDPFELYTTGVLTNPNVIVTGDIGSGKSALVKAFLRRSLAVYGERRFIADGNAAKTSPNLSPDRRYQSCNHAP